MNWFKKLIINGVEYLCKDDGAVRYDSSMNLTNDQKAQARTNIGVTGGGGGTSDYDELSNKPSIESVTLSGNKTASDLGLAKSSDIPSASSATPQPLGTAGAGSSDDFSRADHVHEKPTYSKSDVGLGNVANERQYSANNPPPYPVQSVNGQTGAVNLSIPSTAADVGAIATPSSPSSGQFLQWNGSAWVAASLPVYNGGVS